MGRDAHEEASRKRGFHSKASRRTSAADWQSISGEVLRDTIASVSSRGGALRLGYSRDGGAYCVGVYGDGEPYTEWLQPSDDVENFLTELKEYFEDKENTQEAPQGGKKRSK